MSKARRDSSWPGWQSHCPRWVRSEHPSWRSLGRRALEPHGLRERSAGIPGALKDPPRAGASVVSEKGPTEEGHRRRPQRPCFLSHPQCRGLRTKEVTHWEDLGAGPRGRVQAPQAASLKWLGRWSWVWRLYVIAKPCEEPRELGGGGSWPQYYTPSSAPAYPEPPNTPPPSPLRAPPPPRHTTTRAILQGLNLEGAPVLALPRNRQGLGITPKELSERRGRQ